MGGIVGSLTNATVENVRNEANITSTSSSTSAYVGGIVGYFSGGAISNCSNWGNVSAAGGYIAGIAGSASGSPAYITSCYNAANITPS